MPTETSAQRSARINAAQKAKKQRLKARNSLGNIFEGTFTTTAQAKKNKKFDNLQKTINIAAASKNTKAGPKNKEETFDFKNQAAKALSNKKTNAEPKSKQSTVTKAKTKTIGNNKSKTKQVNADVKKTESKKIVESNAVKEARKKMQESVSKPLSGTVGGDPEVNVSNTKKERRQLLRARRRAGRKSTDGTYTPDQLKAERNKIVKRGTARKQYLRNFASQLARGEQAAPIKGFGEGEGNPANDATLAGTSAEIATKNAETNSFATNILSNFSSIGNDNSDLLSNNIQSLGSFESEDSSPTKYIQKEYRKKRGY